MAKIAKLDSKKIRKSISTKLSNAKANAKKQSKRAINARYRANKLQESIGKIDAALKTIDTLKGKIDQVEQILSGLTAPLGVLGAVVSACKIAINLFLPGKFSPPHALFARVKDKIDQAAAQAGLEQKWALEQIKAKENPQSALYNVYLKQAIEDGYDGPKAQRYATYQTTMKQELENKVGASRISDEIIDFNMQDTTTKGNRNKIANLKKHVGKFVYDVFEGNIKLIQVVDGVVSYKTYNSVADIKADDLIPRTAEEEKVASKYDTPDYSDIGIGQQMLTP